MIPYTIADGNMKRAIMPIEFLTDEGKWEAIATQLDSAADLTVLPYDFAIKLQFLDVQRPLYIREVVGSIAAIQTVVKARIAGKEIKLPIIASAYALDALLGMSAFVDNFKFSFFPEGFEVRPI